MLDSTQLAVAREYGFASWPRLKTEVTRRDGLNSCDPERLAALLAEDSSLAVRRMEHWSDHPKGLVTSDGGADRPPAWLHNVRASPDVGVQIGRERRKGTAKILEPPDPDYDRLWKIVNSNNHDRYSAYQTQTTRAISVIAVTPI